MEAGLLAKVCIWINRFAYLNLLWLVFCLAGLLLVGIFPATAAMFAVQRKWISGRTEIPVFHTFFSTYRMLFWKANQLGFLLLLFGSLLFINFRLVTNWVGVLTELFQLLLLLLSFLYLLVWLYLFPVLVHFEGTGFDTVKNALFTAVSSPFLTVLAIIGVVLLYWFSTILPGILPVLGCSSISFILSVFAQRVFSNIEAKAS
ncbi:DUF624 domain-containing protein [Sediminibacillus dalangtanensis]|uniref:DUF624 domain-containing protein n=1 Tax=Sediminibacillus dalangtanensis TaxID=2729421 RepID=A0ABX7VTU5_9BACI|nr:DUF624 domain-containing protein [Sediminibacillus dalangtanensis]QTM99020.1 DUF624 domain-containing protein [Sediminibacillus dalangtanensis]